MKTFCRLRETANDTDLDSRVYFQWGSDGEWPARTTAVPPDGAVPARIALLEPDNAGTEETMTEKPSSDKQSSSTPRTDAEIMYPGSGIAMVRPEFARQLERELAEAQRYDKRVCDALGMKTVDPEEALNVIDGLRERLRAAERNAAHPCTCHPDDNPPRPCPQKFALSECRKAAESASPSQDAADAARYRWLREANSIIPGKPRVQPIEWYCGTAADEAIDAAMKEGK